MTHDELLAKINEKEPGTLTYSNGEIFHSTRRFISWQLALRAVVEIHKPQNNYAGNTCGYCFALAYELTGLSMEYEDYAYPCPTIQAIEKELG